MREQIYVRQDGTYILHAIKSVGITGTHSTTVLPKPTQQPSIFDTINQVKKESNL